MSFAISFNVSNFGDYHLSFSEKNFQELRTQSYTDLEGWESRLGFKELTVSDGKIIIIAYPRHLRVEKCIYSDENPKPDDETLDTLVDFFDEVWYHLYKGFNPCDGFLGDLPSPIAQEVQEHSTRTFTTPLGTTFNLKRLSPEESYKYLNKDELEVSSPHFLFFTCIISKTDFIHENRRGLSFDFQGVAPFLHPDKSEAITIKVERDGSVSHEGCSLELALEIVWFLS